MKKIVNKIKILCSSIFMVIFMSFFAEATVTVTWNIPSGSETTWKKDKSPYIIPTSITIEGTLTIEPGVKVRFGTSSGMTIMGGGILIAKGTPDAIILFTSHQDTHTKGHWNYIGFLNTLRNSTLKYCQIEYGGRDGYGNIYITDPSAPPIIDSSTISNSATDGIYSVESSSILTIHNCIIRDNDKYPVSARPMIDMKNNTFINNGGGEPTRNVIRIFGSAYYGISKNITWHNQGIPYLITEGNLIIGDFNGAGTLTIESGVTVQFEGTHSIIVGNPSYFSDGCLQAKGTSQAYITFTSSNFYNPAPGDWGYIKFDEYSQNSFLRYCKIEYAGRDTQGPQPAIWCVGASPDISYVDISQVYSHGIVCEYGVNVGTPSSANITYTTIIAGTSSWNDIPASAIYSLNASPKIGSSTLMKSNYGMYCGVGNYLPPYYYPTIKNSNILGNTMYGIYNALPPPPHLPGTVTATNNWWGTPAGPATETTPPDELNKYGDKVSAYVKYNPWITKDNIPPNPVVIKIWDTPEVNTVTLYWLPTGDDFNVGTPSYYVIRYATTSITTETAWNKAYAPKNGTLTPDLLEGDYKGSGRDFGYYYYFSVGSLIPKTEYFFCIRAVDDAGNWSKLSNSPGTTTLPTYIEPYISSEVINGNKYVGLTITNQDSKEVGIWLFYGTKTPVSSQNYINRINVGTLSGYASTFTIVSNLNNGVTYIFVAYAYDPATPTDRNKWSVKSNEVIGRPTVLSRVTITGPVEVKVGSSVTYIARGYGSFGEELTEITYTWSRTPVTLGTFSSTESTSTPTFYAGTKTMKGTLTVQAVKEGMTVTTHLIITLRAGNPAIVRILDKSEIPITKATTTAGSGLFFIGSVTDSYGNPVPYPNYLWHTTIGTLTLTTGTSTTLTSTKAGSGTLTLTADGTSTSIVVTILPASTTKLIFLEIPSPQRIGVPFEITLNSADEFDNFTRDITGMVDLIIRRNETLGATMSLVAGFGTKSISINLPGSYTIYAYGTFNSSILRGTSNSFLVEPGAPTQFVFSLPATTTYVPAGGTTTITAYLADPSGYRIRISGVECTLSIVNGTGTLGTSTTVTDENGEIITTCQVGTTSGSQIRVIITTTSFGGISGTSPLIIVKAGDLARFEFDEIGTQIAGSPFWGTITAKDIYNNSIVDFVGTVALSVDKGEIIPTVTTTFSNGIWNGTITINTAMENASIKAIHLPSRIFGTSNPFNVTPGPLHHINLVPLYATTTVLGTISFRCQGVDIGGNKIDGLTYIWMSQYGEFSTTTTTETSTIFTAGTLATIGTISVSAYDPRSGTRTTIGTVTILPGALTFLSILPSATTMTAGTTLTLTVIGYDAYWNTTTIPSCVWETDIGTVTYNPPGTIAYLYATKTPSAIVTAIANGIATSTIITVEPASLHHFIFTPLPDSIVAGAKISFTIIAKDVWENTATGFSGTGSLYLRQDDRMYFIWVRPHGYVPVNNGVSPFIGDSLVRVSERTSFVFIYSQDETKRGTSNTFSITPATETARFNIYLGGTSIPIGGTTSVTIKLEDRYRNPVKIEGATATLSVIGTGTLNILSGATDAEGVIEAIFTAPLIVGTESIIQVVSDYGTQTSGKIVTIPGPVDSFVFEPIPESEVAGVEFPITISAKDFAGNTVTYYNEVATLIVYQDGIPKGIITPNQIRFENGTATGTVSITLVAGTVTIVIYSENRSGTSNPINIRCVSLFIIPQDTVTRAGEVVSYTAVASDIKGNTWIVTSETKFEADDPFGRIFNGNIYEAGKVGTWTIHATYQNVSTSTQVIVERGTPTLLSLIPQDVKIRAGDLVTYAAIASDIKGNTWTVTLETTFETNDPLGRIINGNTYEAGKVGTWTIHATYQTVSTSTQVVVERGTLTLLSLTPKSVKTRAGDLVTYAAIASDIKGNTWTVTSETEFRTDDPEGRIINGNIYEAGKVGTWTIYGYYKTIFVFTRVIVVQGTPTSLSISPKDVTIIAGDKVIYTAIASDIKGNTWTVTSETKFVTDDPWGTITNVNIYEAGKVGTWTIQGIYQNVSTSAQVVVERGEPILLSIIPQNVKTKSGDLVTYTAIISDIKGNTWTVTSETSFETNDPLGRIFSGNIYEAGKVGTWTIQGTYKTIGASTQVIVEPGTPTLLSIIPKEITIRAGDKVIYTAIASDIKGNTWTATSETRFEANDPLGRIFNGNIYEAGKVGTWTIQGIYQNVSTSAQVVVKRGEPILLSIIPQDVKIKAGDLVTYTAIISDIKGNTWTVTWETIFETNDPFGKIINGNIYEAGKVGTWTIQGTYKTIGASTQVIVEPGTPTLLSIIPKDVTIKAGDKVIYTSIALDTKGNTWTVTSETSFETNDPLGAIINGNIYEAGKVGTWTIYATYQAVSTFTQVIVERGIPTLLSLIPKDVKTRAGDLVNYTAIASDIKGNTWTVTSETIFETNDPLGKIIDGNIYEAGKVGTWTIHGRYQTVDTSTQVIVEQGTPTLLSLIPKDIKTRAGELVTYTAIVSDIKGNTWTVTSETIFETNDPLGKITNGNIYEAGKVGTWTIQGRYKTISASTQVVVEPGTPTLLFIIPKDVTIKAGDKVIYTSTALDTKGNTWTVTLETIFETNDPLGKITNGNIYEAGKVGTWTIQGRYKTISASTQVVVEPGTPTLLSIIPKDITIRAGDKVSYTAIASDIKGNTWTVTAQTQFVTTDPVGNITLDGTYIGGKVGRWIIRGVYRELVGSTTVYVKHGTATRLFISPAIMTVSAGETVSYTTVAQDSQGNTWTVTAETVFATNDPVGTMTAGKNIYTAGRIGTWTIYATYTLTPIGTTAIIYVKVGELHHFKIKSISKHWFKNEQGTITISAYDRMNNLVATSTSFTLGPQAIISPSQGILIDGRATMTVSISKGGVVVIEAYKDNIYGSISLIVLIRKEKEGTEAFITPDNLVTKVIIPPHTVATDYYVIMDTPTEKTDPNIAIANNKVIFPYTVIKDAIREFSIKNELGHRVSIPPTATISIIIPYKDEDPRDEYAEVNGVKVKEDTIWIYRLEGNRWIKIPQQKQHRNIIENWVSAEVDRFSIFTLIGEAVAVDLKKVLVFPNPVRVDKDPNAQLNFTNLSRNATIRIYTISGELVKIKEGIEGTWSWDLKNKYGQPVASGVYIYIIHDEDEIVRGKIAVIR